MSRKAVYLLGILLTIILGSILYYNVCTLCCTNEQDVAPVTEPPKTATKNPFLVQDPESDFKVEKQDNINFKVSGITILTPISNNVEAGVDSLKMYLQNNPFKNLKITGFYTSVETNNSAFPNLGLARANAVKNYFVSKGMSSKQIDTYGELLDSMEADQEQIYYGPESYAIWTRSEDDHSRLDALKLIKEDIVANPLVLYFDIAKASISLTSEQREKVAEISRYLDKIDDASITIVGHTDNTGDKESNMVLGQDRADFAKTYFIKNHIPENKITTISKGQTEPIADNGTEAGRAENRRTIVILN